MSTTTAAPVSTDSSAGPSAPRGHGAANSGQRGRGNWRGRGRGRGGIRGGHRGGTPRQTSGGAPQEGVEERSRASASSRTERESKPPLTHFLSLPLGHHAELRDRVSVFTRSLLDSLPPIPGLDESIVISPRRLHITLGVMSLTDASDPPASDHGASGGGEDRPPRTVGAALRLLNELKPQLQEMLAGERLRVALRHVDIMRPDRGDLEKAHVMWAGPPRDSEDARRLRRVAEFVLREFKIAGLVIDDKRSLKMHCTIVNTLYRRPKPKGGRTPFSYAAVLSSPALEAIKVQTQGAVVQATVEDTGVVLELQERVAKTWGAAKQSIEVDLGAYTIDDIQVCEMGSWGPEGEYVSVGGVTLD